MASKHLSIRMDPKSLERLDAESRRMRLSRSEVARTLLDEGLRMEAHPGIVFRPGPTGRRAGLKDGPDVWEIVSLYQDMGGPGEEALSRTCEWASLRPDQVHAALKYYAEYPVEIDDRIRRNHEEAERGYADWLREQQVLER
jgi:uncharacterized protein (DUF433 family)